MGTVSSRIYLRGTSESWSITLLVVFVLQRSSGSLWSVISHLVGFVSEWQDDQWSQVRIEGAGWLWLITHPRLHDPSLTQLICFLYSWDSLHHLHHLISHLEHGWSQTHRLIKWPESIFIIVAIWFSLAKTISDHRPGGRLWLITHLRLHDPSPPAHHSHRWCCDLSWAKTIFTIFSWFLFSRFGRTVMDILLIKDRSWSLLPDAISGCRINYALWGRLFTSCCPLLCTTKNSAAFEAIIF